MYEEYIFVRKEVTVKIVSCFLCGFEITGNFFIRQHKLKFGKRILQSSYYRRILREISKFKGAMSRYFRTHSIDKK